MSVCSTELNRRCDGGCYPEDDYSPPGSALLHWLVWILEWNILNDRWVRQNPSQRRVTARLCVWCPEVSPASVFKDVVMGGGIFPFAQVSPKRLPNGPFPTGWSCASVCSRRDCLQVLRILSDVLPLRLHFKGFWLLAARWTTGVPSRSQQPGLFWSCGYYTAQRSTHLAVFMELSWLCSRQKAS